MNKKIDNFLIGTLWLTASILCACFWFNSRFGFNIFKGADWLYLGMLQATGAKINSWFYFCIIFFIFMMTAGLYFLISTKLRKIVFKPLQNDASVFEITKTASPEDTAHQQVRPHRLIPAIQNNYQTNLEPEMPEINIPIFTTRADISDEIKDVFKRAGYIIKTKSFIKNFTPTVVAIGSEETLWIGANAEDGLKLISVIEKLKSTFSETLEEIEITVYGFVIKNDAFENTLDGLLYFDTIEDFSNYLPKNEAESSETGVENFDAYSEYIDTIAEYFNKL